MHYCSLLIIYFYNQEKLYLLLQIFQIRNITNINTGAMITPETGPIAACQDRELTSSVE